MVVNDKGVFAGSVSGGCVETEVIARAMELAGGGSWQRARFDAGDGSALDMGLPCGGAIELVLMPEGDAAFLRQWRDGGDKVLALNLSAPARQLMPDPAHLAHPDDWQSVCRDALQTGDAVRLDHAGEAWFLLHLDRAPHLVISGAVHMARCLSAMAAVAGMASTIIDPRAAFITPERFPRSRRVGEWPDEALQHFRLNRSMAMVALAHKPEFDDPLLLAALAAECFYIGALGSRKTHERRMRRLEKAGAARAALRRIHAPIGLDIGARGPEEIAVAILAEIISARRQIRLARADG
jgi:xanthine dehydrogenase accessory factor